MALVFCDRKRRQRTGLQREVCVPDGERHRQGHHYREAKMGRRYLRKKYDSEEYEKYLESAEDLKEYVPDFQARVKDFYAKYGG